MSYSNWISFPASDLTTFIDALSAAHGDLDIDIKLIDGIVNGWIRGKHIESLEELCTYLRSKERELNSVIEDCRPKQQL